MQHAPRLLPLAALALAIPASPAHARQTLVKDFNTAPNPSIQHADPERFLELNGRVIFRASTPATGDELWSSDGTAVGTELLADLYPGSVSSQPRGVVLDSGVIVFTAETPSTGREVFVTDGTTAGTTLLLDIVPGPGSSVATSLTADGLLAFFEATDAGGDRELWVTDATPAGTKRVADLSTGSTNFIGMLAVDDRAYFSATTDAGSQFWTSDGTAVGTVPLTPVAANGGNFGTRIAHFDAGVVFLENDPAVGWEPWITNGTPGGTFRLSGATPGSAGDNPEFLVDAGPILYYRANDPNIGVELYRTDGTIAGTWLVADLRPNGGVSKGSYPHPVGPIGTDLLFTADDGTGSYLFRTDGSPGNATQLAAVGSAGFRYLYADGQYANELNGERYFSGVTSGNDLELWKTDGTTLGTVRVADLQAGSTGSFPDELAVLAGRLWFSADDGLTGIEPWTCDGSTVTQVADVAPPLVSLGSMPGVVGAFRDQALVYADDGTGSGREPWLSDGTPAGTYMLADLRPGAGSSVSAPGNPKVSVFAATADYFLFFADTPGLGEEPWISDGTAAGTKLLLDVEPGSEGGGGHQAFPYGDQVVFVSGDVRSPERDLYLTDGTAAGTTQLAHLEPFTFGSGPEDFVEWNGKLFFRADDGTGYELFASDGTAAGTRQVLEIGPGSSDGLRGPIVEFGNKLWFAGWGGPPFGTELWVCPGGQEGTRVFADLAPGSASSVPRGLAAIDAGLLFFATAEGGEALWITNGVDPPQAIVSRPGSNTTSLYSLGERAVFLAQRSSTQAELWGTDGTAGGTQLLRTFVIKNLLPGEGAFWRLGASRLFFRADDGTTGVETWVTDGTAAGTKVVVDIGFANANPNSLRRAGTRVLLAADDGLRGSELHAFDLADGDEWAAETYGLGCAGTGGLVPAIGLTGAVQASSPGPFSIDLTGARANATAFLLWSPLAASLELAPGCKLYLGTPLRSRAVTTDASGAASVSYAPVPAMVGHVARFQWAVLDPAGALNGKWSLSDALELVAGP